MPIKEVKIPECEDRYLEEKFKRIMNEAEGLIKELYHNREYVTSKTIGDSIEFIENQLHAISKVVTRYEQDEPWFSESEVDSMTEQNSIRSVQELEL